MSRSQFDLAPILQSVVDTAARLCRAEKAVIFRLEDGLYRFAAGYSLDPKYIEIEKATLIAPGPGTAVGRAAMDKQVVRIDDALSDPHYAAKDDAKIGDVRSTIGVPLMREGEAIGVIALARSRVEPFNEREIESGDHLRRPGRDRDRERAPVRRGAGAHRRPFGIAAAADRHRRRAQGHQSLDLRLEDGARHADRRSAARLCARDKARSLRCCDGDTIQLSRSDG